MSSLPVFVRADASPSIGRGHLARCSAFVQALRSRDVTVVLLSHRLPDVLAGPLVAGGTVVHGLDSAVDHEEVAAAITGLCGSAGGPTLVIDHYSLDARWQAALRPFVSRLVALEDRPIRAHDVDLLVDANGGLDRSQRYVPLVDGKAQIVTGHDHALIDLAYARLQQEHQARQGLVRRVLVQLGSDRSGLVDRVVAALREIAAPGLHVDVVLPGGHGSLPQVHQLAVAAGWRVHTDVEDMQELYAQVDLAIAAPGVSVWERCAMGVPSVVIETTPRHAGAYADLAGSPAVTNLGQATELGHKALLRALDLELRREDLWERSVACRRLVDGRGASRMASLLTARADQATTLREQDLGDEARLLRWANDPWTRAWSLPSQPIAADEHADWFRNHLANPARFRQYMLEDAWGTELGSVRFEREGSVWEMSAVLAPGFRGRGFASVLIRQGCDRLATDLGEDVEVAARVLPIRPGAGRALTRLGFTETGTDEQSGSIAFRRVWRVPGGGERVRDGLG